MWTLILIVGVFVEMSGGAHVAVENVAEYETRSACVEAAKTVEFHTLQPKMREPAFHIQAVCIRSDVGAK